MNFVNPVNNPPRRGFPKTASLKTVALALGLLALSCTTPADKTPPPETGEPLTTSLLTTPPETGKPFTTSLPDDVKLEMVAIPAGDFLMGSPAGETARSDKETQHPVRISKPFWLGKYEVTQGQWKALMGNYASEFKGSGDNAPVEDVLWEEAMEFCKQLTERERSAGRLPEGYVYTLPTEAQWEYACRAGTTTPFNTGSNLTTEQANYDGNHPYDKNAKEVGREQTVPVGSFPPNAWGLYDMHGNVWEWCRDTWSNKDDYFLCYREDEKGRTYKTEVDPLQTTKNGNVQRGGSWHVGAQHCRSASRSGGGGGKDAGFRVALALPRLFDAAAKATAPEVKTSPPETGKPFTTSLPNDVKLEMVSIPAGSFLMGSPKSEKDRKNYDETQHPVRLSKSFWLGKYEVTQGQWKTLMSNNPSWFQESGDNVPVENVLWEDAMEFCKKLTQRERLAGRLPAGYVYTLPTEAQWEYACRAGTTTPFNTGSNLTTGEANYDGKDSNDKDTKEQNREQTVAVGSFFPNAWELYDMHGNVSEWCRDSSDGRDYLLRYKIEIDPLQDWGSGHVTRGGNWLWGVEDCRSSMRKALTSAHRSGLFGFRVALAPSPLSAEADKTITLEVRASAPEIGKPFTANLPGDTKLEMVSIPAGSFLMGSPKGESDRRAEETQHPVHISKSFWLGKYEVTQEQWKAMMGKTPSGSKGNGNLPVTRMSWNEAMEFCKELTKREGSAGRLPAGYAYTLPTEAQWEYACRAETTTPFNTGSNLTTEQANYDGREPYNGNAKGQFREQTLPVGSLSPNAWGLYDMHGNVVEWCRDSWDGKDYPLRYTENEKGRTYQTDVDPLQTAGNYRIQRGGAWTDMAANCRSAARRKLASRGSSEKYGLRIALAPVPLSATADKSAAPEIKITAPEIKTSPPETGKPFTASLPSEVKLEMVAIPAGSFLMGSPKSERDNYSNETQHPVRLSKSFWLGKYEVTQGQWKALMVNNPSEFKGGADNVPVEKVSWRSAMEFCRRLTERERSAGRLPAGYVYTLPTEAQWEYACRAGTTTPFNTGLNLTTEQANYNGNKPYKGNAKGQYREQTLPVGSFPPNAWSLYDMHGNVEEWCRDSTDDYGTQHRHPKGEDEDEDEGTVQTEVDPLCTEGERHVVRGGSWSEGAQSCRSAARPNSATTNSSIYRGFRVALVHTLLFKEGKKAAAPEIKTSPPETAKSFTTSLPGEAKLEMVSISAGYFLMGSPKDSFGLIHETQHPVRISKSFWLGKYEVTQEQWKALMGNNPSSFKESWDNIPVENVSWHDAMEFCKKLTERERSAGRLPADYVYTLPTEAQWEYACRAGTTTPFNTGLNLTTEQANYNGEHPYKENARGQYRKQTVPVGSFAPNAWGLYDMHGNVREWCRDSTLGKDYLLHYEKTKKRRTYHTEVDPLQTAGSRHIFRGGAWNDIASWCCSTSRFGVNPSTRTGSLGFRVALVSSLLSARVDKTIAPEAEVIVPKAGKPFTINLPNGTKLGMVSIPAGNFLMGSPAGEKDRDDKETQHPVRISEQFWLGKYEVTQGQWKALMDKNPSAFKKSGDNVPVEEVLWEDAMQFCKRLTERERSEGRLPAGYVYTLPTEAQWEYACRAGTTTPFNTGSNLTRKEANYDDKKSYEENTKGKNRGRTMPVGSFAPNAWGLYDMHGNVWEWCRDSTGGDYYLRRSVENKEVRIQMDVDPVGTIGTGRVVRGGSWSFRVGHCRSAARFHLDPDFHSKDYGFRVALVPESVR
jgi:formylglycine-generating enzyme required for sulfatase activity